MPEAMPRRGSAVVAKRALNILPQPVWEAVAFVQANFGVPDKWIAKVAQCGQSTVVEKRNKNGWVVRKLPENFDEVAGAASAQKPDEVDTALALSAKPFDDAALLRLTETLMLKIATEVASSERDDFDHMALKRLEVLTGASKSVERLVESRKALGSFVGNPLHAPASAEETAVILKKIGTRVNDLAERKFSERLANDKRAGNGK